MIQVEAETERLSHFDTPSDNMHYVNLERGWCLNLIQFRGFRAVQENDEAIRGDSRPSISVGGIVQRRGWKGRNGP